MTPFADHHRRGLESALIEIGSPGGVLDAADRLDRGPVQLIADSSLSVHNPDNPTHTAGTTFMGQFMDHDMTFDLASPLGRPADPLDRRTVARRRSTSTRSMGLGLSARPSSMTRSIA